VVHAVEQAPAIGGQRPGGAHGGGGDRAVVAVRFAKPERIERARLQLPHQRGNPFGERGQVLGQIAVGQVPVLRLADAEALQRFFAFAAAHGADVVLARARITLRTIGRVHDGDRLAATRVPREHATGADHLVVGMGGEHEHGAQQRVARQQRCEQVFHDGRRSRLR
jgi:hypothetical protein